VPAPDARTRRLELARMLMGGDERAKTAAPPPRAPTAPPAPLPTRKPPSKRPAEPPKPVGPSGASRVLVIDDDQAIRDMVGQILARENQVYQAVDGENALSVLKQIPAVDVIVCDVMMPKLDGFEFAKAAKADPALASIPILFLTARDQAMDHVKGIQAGARSYLTKPFKVKDLLVAVRRATTGR
jgi:CheY-like chemotaxis protein